MVDISMTVPEKINMTTCVLDRRVEAGEGNRAAIYYRDRVISFQELHTIVNRYGNALLAIGIRAGDRVIIRTPTSPESIATIMATIKIGAVPIPLSTLLGVSELRYILADSEAVAYCGSPGFFVGEDVLSGSSVTYQINLAPDGECATNLPGLALQMPGQLDAHPTRRSDPAFILYSTGTTGAPKGILHGHQFIVGVGETMGRRWMQLEEGDVVLHPHELSFSYAWSAGFWVPLYCGVPLVIFAERFTPQSLFEHLERYRVTTFCTVPTAYRMLLSYPQRIIYSLESLKRCISAGEPLPEEVSVQWLREVGVPIFDGIGTSETFLFCAQSAAQSIVHGSMGKPLPGYEVTVHDENGLTCRAGIAGQLAIKEGNPSLFLEYIKLKEKWELTHKNGWFYPGDYAYVDENGYFWHVSRSDDIIKSRGYLISPREVEEALVSHLAVQEAGVIGLTDPVTGQKVKAFLVLVPGIEPSRERAEEIREWVRGRIALFKAPKEIQFVSDLPRTPSGKLLRRTLRELDERQKKNGPLESMFIYDF